MSLRSRVLDIFFPRACVGCQQTDTWLCGSCCMNIQQPLHQKLNGVPINSLFTLGTYTTPALRTAIRTIKFHRVSELTRLFGILLGNAVRNVEIPSHGTVVIAVPLHRRRRRFRGFDQAEYIASSMASVLGTPFITHALSREHATRPQAQRHAYERRTMPRFDFQLRTILPPHIKHILLVDDVITTGATMMATAHVLKQTYPDLHIHGIALARPS